jgi:LmbE family N-acetylglucosaminyl deacetylase
VIDPWRRVLVLAPHTDDGEFGCGGTMARLAAAGVEVHYVAFSIATRSLPEGFPPDTLARECREATAELGIPESQLTVHDFDVRTFPERRQDILELLVALWDELRPDAVFQPSHHDVHQDHQTVAQEGLRAFKRTTVLGYEIPWNNLDFSYGAYFALEEAHVERKIAALERYASQQHRRYANPEYVRNLARVHGINVNRDFAKTSKVADTPRAIHGWYTARVTTPATAPSSARLAPTFENGSGEALIASRRPDLTRCETSAVPPPKVT